MSVEQMMLVSRILLALMIVLFVLAIVLFFVLDIKKAWSIIIKGKKLYHHETRKTKRVEKSIVKQRQQTLKKDTTTDILEDVAAEGLKDTPTAVLEQEKYGETSVLEKEEYGVTSVLMENGMEILVDIKLIHTQVVI